VADPAAEALDIAAGARHLGVVLDADQVGRLAAFAGLLAHWNRAFNLVSRQDIGRLRERHLLDSLSVTPWLAGSEVMDLGTGAGLPGIPLAIARPDLQFTLVDRSPRKIRFVQQAIRSLALGNVTVHAGDVRGLPEPRRFDTIVSRAVAEVGVLWALGGERLRPGGRMLVLWRSQSRGDARAPANDDLATSLPDTVHAVQQEVSVPGLARSHRLIVVESTGGAQ
jgi:16S rRNA (guanine527-N7)-methyltransferase